MFKTNKFLFGALTLALFSLTLLNESMAGNREAEGTKYLSHPKEKHQSLQPDLTRKTSKDQTAKQLLRKMQKDKDCPNPPCKGNDVINKIK